MNSKMEFLGLYIQFINLVTEPVNNGYNGDQWIHSEPEYEPEVSLKRRNLIAAQLFFGPKNR